ncbi:hypothetical protein IPF37_00235 [bacterium]|nr:MAG: hypothetical protein IPF37_00235 [bacterium]
MSRSIKRPSALRALHLLTLLLLLNPATAWTAADTLPTKAPHQKKGSKKHAPGKKGHKAKKTHATVQVVQPKQKVHAIPGAIPARFLKLLRKEINRTVAQAKEEEQKAPEQRRQRRPNVGRKTHKRRVGGRHKKRIARGKSKQKRRPKFLKKNKKNKMQKLAANDHIMQEIMNRKNRRQGGGKGGHKQKKHHVKKRLQHPRAKLQQPRAKIKGGNIQSKIERERERVEKNMIADQYLKDLQAKKAAGTTLTEQETAMLERLEQKKADKKAIKALLLKDPKKLTPEEKKTLADHARAKQGVKPKHGGKQKVISSKKYPARKPHKQAGKKIKGKPGKRKKHQDAVAKKAQIVPDDQASADDQAIDETTDAAPKNTGIVPSKISTKRIVITEPAEQAAVEQQMALDEATLIAQPAAATTDQAAADAAAAAEADYQQKMAEYNKQLAEYNAAVAAQQAQASSPDQGTTTEQPAAAAQPAATTTDQAATDAAAAAEADYQQKMAEYNKQLAEYNAAVAAQQAQASSPDQGTTTEQPAAAAPEQPAAPSRRRTDQGLPPGRKASN